MIDEYEDLCTALEQTAQSVGAPTESMDEHGCIVCLTVRDVAMCDDVPLCPAHALPPLSYRASATVRHHERTLIRLRAADAIRALVAQVRERAT